MERKFNKKDYVIKKKHIPAFLSALSFFLAIIWVSIVLMGVLKEFDSETLKTFTGKKIVFSLVDNEEKKTLLKTEEEVVAENHNQIAIIMEIQQPNDLNEILTIIPKNIAIGLPREIANFDKLKIKLNSVTNNYLIKLPLVAHSSNKDYEIYPGIDIQSLNDKLDNLFKNSNAIGVYNIGQEEFLERDLDNFANIISNLNKRSLLLLYGINEKTTIFESDNENIFSVEACDEVIDTTTDNTLQMIDKLTHFEDTIKNKGKGVLFIKAADENLPKELLNWLTSIEKKNIKIVNFNQLPKTLSINAK